MSIPPKTRSELFQQTFPALKTPEYSTFEKDMQGGFIVIYDVNGSFKNPACKVFYLRTLEDVRKVTIGRNFDNTKVIEYHEIFGTLNDTLL